MRLRHWNVEVTWADPPTILHREERAFTRWGANHKRRFWEMFGACPGYFPVGRWFTAQVTHNDGEADG